jgi:hypothetical protein
MDDMLPGKLFGKYRGVASDGADPTNRGRLRMTEDRQPKLRGRFILCAEMERRAINLWLWSCRQVIEIPACRSGRFASGRESFTRR